MGSFVFFWLLPLVFAWFHPIKAILCIAPISADLQAVADGWESESVQLKTMNVQLLNTRSPKKTQIFAYGLVLSDISLKYI